MKPFNITPPKNSKTMDELFAVLSVEPDGREGIMAHMIGGNWMPFVTSEAEHAMRLWGLAREYMKDSNVRIRLVKFSKREVIFNV